MFLLALVAAAVAGPQPEIAFGAKAHPAGAAVLTNLYFDAGPVDAGPSVDLYYYWYELDFTARTMIYDGFIVLAGGAGWEPGWYKRADDPDGPRQFMSRPIGRAQANINLRNDLVWLYLLGSGLTRHRSFDEFDPYKDVVFDEGLELFGSGNAALMFSPSGTAERKAWFYGEITLEAEHRIGYTDRLPRAGVILEKLTPSITLLFDVSYSLMDTAVGGPGALFVFYWIPPPQDPAED